jgi:hypothetical protein
MKTLKVELTAVDLETLKRKMEHYWTMFHPLGYDTRLDRPAYYDESRKLFVAQITRLESCD